MTNEEIILEKIKEMGYITSNLVAEIGIDRWYLTSLVEKGKLQRVGRGIYIDMNGTYDEYQIFQYQNTKAIFSYATALYYHGLTDQIPSNLEVTVYQGYNTHRFPNNIFVHYVQKSIYELGIIEGKSIYGNPIQVYDKERTLCDLVVSKKVVESEVFKKAFQEYFKHPNKDVYKLMKYAKKLKIETEMFTLVEVLS